MRISSNKKLIERNKKISQVVLYASLALLSLGFLWSVTNPGSSQATFAYVILIPAYILVQVSIFMANRWGRSPRPDEIIATSLKGLNNQYSLYNYTTSVPHVLIGPAGLWIIKPYHHAGTISYNQDKKRYDQKGGPGFVAKLFAQESLPNIERESKYILTDFQNYLKTNQIVCNIEPKIVNLFYSEKVDVRASNAPEVNLEVNKFKEFIRQTAKKVNLSDAAIQDLTQKMPAATE